MNFYDKYPELKEKAFLTQMLTDTVFATMALADQEVPKQKVKQIVLDLLEEKEIKGDQFFSDQVY